MLHIYWSNHFLFNSRISDFRVSPTQLFDQVGGLRRSTKQTFLHRFEALRFHYFSRLYWTLLPREVLRGLNVLLSQLSTVNNQTHELVRLTLIRLYLIKSRRGRFQALGKPIRGQRTWSNAWTAHYKTSPLRAYINTCLRKEGRTKEVKKDYRRVARKFKKTRTTPLSAKKAKKTLFLWF